MEVFLLEPQVDESLLAARTDRVDLEQVMCPANSDHQRAGRRMSNLHLEATQEALAYDFLWSWHSDCLLREQAITTLRNQLTGIDTGPATISTMGVRAKPTFSEVVVTGWGGVAAESSGVRLVSRCEACGHLRYTGVTNWEALVEGLPGTVPDFFIVWPLPRYRWLSERAAEVLAHNRLTGYRLVSPKNLPASEMGYSPGRVSYWLPSKSIDDARVPGDIR